MDDNVLLCTTTIRIDVVHDALEASEGNELPSR